MSTSMRLMLLRSLPPAALMATFWLGHSILWAAMLCLCGLHGETRFGVWCGWDGWGVVCVHGVVRWSVVGGVFKVADAVKLSREKWLMRVV